MKSLELYKRYMFAPLDEVKQNITSEPVVNRLLRVRELYVQVLADPTKPDRVVVDEYRKAHNLQQRQAYEDLTLVKQLLPMLTQATRDFHRFRYNEMIMQVYNSAKEEGDLKTMERAASSYARFNKIDEEDLQAVPYDDIVVQPFTATDDPTVLGIKPVPNLRKRIDTLLKRYGADNPDIEDVEAEEPDL